MGRRGAPPRRRLMVRCVAAVVVALVMADTIATTLAVPTLGLDPIGAGLSVTELTWMNTAYFAAVAALLVTAGRFADLLGRRAILAIGLMMFAAGATAVVIAPAWPVVLAGRVAQGIGAAAMFPSCLALLLGAVGERRRGAMALWSASSGVGALVVHGGGGLLMQQLGWRGLFVPSATVGIALLVVVPVLPRSVAAARVRPDLVGAALLVAASAAGVLTISQGGGWGWTSTRTLGGAAAAVLLLSGALARARRHPGAAIDWSLWRRPGLAWGGVATFMSGLLAFPLLMVIPLVLGEVGVAMAEIGWWLAPMSLAVVVASPIAGAISRRVSVHAVIYVGAATIGVACTVMLAYLPLTAWPHGATVAALVLAGMGCGTLNTGGAIAATAATTAEQHGAAMGALSTARMLGGAVGIAAASALLELPLLSGPMAGYGSVISWCVLISVLTAALALAQAVRRIPAAIPAGARQGDPVADPAVGGLSAAEEVVRLRRLLREVRADLAQISSDAAAELAVMQQAPQRAVPPAQQWPGWHRLTVDAAPGSNLS